MPQPFVPPPPLRPPTIRLGENEYLIEGVARVRAKPHRSMADAARFARSIASRPDAYLAVCTALKVPGIDDLRPRRGTAALAPGVAFAPLTLANERAAG